MLDLSLSEWIWGVVLLGSVLVIGGCGGGETTSSVSKSERTEPGDLRATVRFQGEAPERRRIDASGNKECRTDSILGEQVVVNENGTLRNAVVAIDSGPRSLEHPEARPPVIDQSGCKYVPHVVTVRAGDTFVITHSDSGMHNVRGLSPTGDQLFNEVTFNGDRFQKSFTEPGIYGLECNVHPWMEAWVYAYENGPAAVTRDRGTVSFSELPPGTYRLRFWHEEYGEKTRTVRVKPGKETAMKISFRSKLAQSAPVKEQPDR